MESTTYSKTSFEKAKEAYMEQAIRYLYEPSLENRKFLFEKMKVYSQHSGVLFHLEEMEKIHMQLDRGYESAWETFANEAEKSWFFDIHPELCELFYKAAEKRGLAKKKWVICSD